MCTQGINLAVWVGRQEVEKEREGNPTDDISIAGGWHNILYLTAFFVEEKPSVSLLDSLILP